MAVNRLLSCTKQIFPLQQVLLLFLKHTNIYTTCMCVCVCVCVRVCSVNLLYTYLLLPMYEKLLQDHRIQYTYVLCKNLTVPFVSNVFNLQSTKNVITRCEMGSTTFRNCLSETQEQVSNYILIWCIGTSIA